MPLPRSLRQVPRLRRDRTERDQRVVLAGFPCLTDRPAHGRARGIQVLHVPGPDPAAYVRAVVQPDDRRVSLQPLGPVEHVDVEALAGGYLGDNQVQQRPVDRRRGSIAGDVAAADGLDGSSAAVARDAVDAV